MKVVVTDGCTAYGCTVGDKNIEDISMKEIKDVFNKLIDIAESRDILIEQFKNFVSSAGEWEFLGHCDQCGDDICEYTIEV